ncbi:transglycosylase domain-containing protein [Bounagaea algeriensis]
MTHGGVGGYDYYAATGDHPDEDSYAPADSYGPASDGEEATHVAHSPGPGGPAERSAAGLSAKAARRRKTWRRVRRSCYVAACLMFIAPVLVFAYGYFSWKTPTQEDITSQKQPVQINYSDGSRLATVEDEGSRRMINSLDDVSPAVRNATISAEDDTFYSNPGFDVMGILRSAFFLVTGTGSGGGSTLTQQFIKLHLELNDKNADYVRKVKEIVLAYKMTQQQDKDDILKAYLNTAYYGRGATGITAASEAYFGKSPDQLTQEEAAVLAGAVQRPYDNDPRGNAEQAQERWDYVTGRMVANGFMSEQERQQASMPQTRDRTEWRQDNRLTPVQSAIKNRVLDELEREGYNQQTLSTGGYSVNTTIDPRAQQAAERAVQETLQGEPESVRTSLVAVDPENGAVRAYNGGATEVEGLDYANQPQQPGSSFKPFVAAAGLQQGQGIGRYYDGTAPQEIAGTVFDNSEGVSCDVPTHCGVREAMTKSVNTPFVNMATQFGPGKVAEAAHAAGIPQEYGDQPTLQSPNGGVDAGIALGMYPVRPIDMAAGYASFANDGMRVDPHMVQSITHTVEGEKQEIQLHTAQPQPAYASDRAESKNIAANVAETLMNVVDHSDLGLDGGRPVAAKTGTHQFGDTDDNQNAWMIGATPQISASVSMLAEDEQGSPTALTDSSGSMVYGSGLPGEAWQRFMNTYHEGMPIEQFPDAKPIGQYADVPPSTSDTSSQPPSSSSTPPTTSSQQPSETSQQPSETESSEPTSSDPLDENCGIFGCPEDGDEEPAGPPGMSQQPSRTEREQE